MPKVDVVLSIGGKKLLDAVTVESVELDMGLDRHHVARIRLVPGDATSSSAKRSSGLDQAFDGIGKSATLEIQASGDMGADLTFEGLVTRATHERERDGDHHLVLTVVSPTTLLETGPRCRVWEERSANDIAQAILSEVGGIDADVGALPTRALPYEAQYEESNWAFLRRLAAREGMWLYYDGSTLNASNSFSGAETRLAVGTEASVPRFEQFSLETRVVPGGFRHTAILPDSKEDAAHGESDGGSTDASNEFVKLARQRSLDLFKSPAHPPRLGEVFVEEDQKRQSEATVQAWLRTLVVASGITTYPGLKPGSLVRLEGTGGKEDDAYVVVDAIHRVSGSGYTCALELVPSVAAYPDVEPPPRATGLQRGIVVDKYDPEFSGMVKVRYARAVDGDTAEGKSTDGQAVTTWVRVAAPQAGETGGIVAVPEVGDEVIIGHVGGRATQPVVLGSVYTKEKKSKVFSEIEDLIGDNDGKAWLTKSGNLILLSDADGKQTIELRSPDGRNSLKLTLDGGAQVVVETEGEVSIRAKKDVRIRADGDMTLESGGDLKLDAKGQLKASSVGKMSLESTQALEAKGLEFKAQGQVSAEMSAAKVDVKGSAITSVSGALVKIN